jgi:hypothetical protein
VFPEPEFERVGVAVAVLPAECVCPVVGLSPRSPNDGASNEPVVETPTFVSCEWAAMPWVWAGTEWLCELEPPVEFTESEPRSRAKYVRMSGVPLFPSHSVRSGSRSATAPRYSPMIRVWVPPPVLRSTLSRRLGGSSEPEPVVPPPAEVRFPVLAATTSIGCVCLGSQRGVEEPYPASWELSGLDRLVAPIEWSWLNPVWVCASTVCVCVAPPEFVPPFPAAGAPFRYRPDESASSVQPDTLSVAQPSTPVG